MIYVYVCACVSEQMNRILNVGGMKTQASTKHTPVQRRTSFFVTVLFIIILLFVFIVHLFLITSHAIFIPMRSAV